MNRGTVIPPRIIERRRSLPASAVFTKLGIFEFRGIREDFYFVKVTRGDAPESLALTDSLDGDDHALRRIDGQATGGK